MVTLVRWLFMEVWFTNLIGMMNTVDRMERGKQQATGRSRINQKRINNQHLQGGCWEHLWALWAAKPHSWRRFSLERCCSVTFQTHPSIGAQNIYSENRKPNRLNVAHINFLNPALVVFFFLQWQKRNPVNRVFVQPMRYSYEKHVGISFDLLLFKMII